MPTELKITCDASEYNRTLEETVQKSRAAAAAIQQDGTASASNGSTPAGGPISAADAAPPHVDVTAKVEGLEQVRELAQTIDKLPDKKTVTVSAAGANAAATEVKAVGTAANSAAGGIKGFFQGIRAELNNTAGGTKKLVSSLLAGGGAVGIILAGIASIGKLIAWGFELAEQKIKEAGELADRNAESVRNAAAANEELRSKTDGYIGRLTELSSKEKLGNAEKLEAIRLIKEMSGAYGDLGMRLDETTGKVTGVDQAIARKLKIDHDRRISELQADLRNIEDDDRVQRELRDHAGVPIWIDGDTRVGGEETVKAAQAKLDENAAKKNEIRRKLAELRRQDPEKDHLEKRKAETSDAADAAQKQRDEARYQQWRSEKDAAFDSATSNDSKRQNRLSVLAAEKERLAELRQIYDAAEATRRKTAAGSIEEAEATRAAHEAETKLVAAEERVAAVKRQIAGLDKARALTISDAANAGKKELEINRLLARGEFEKAEALKLQQQLKTQGIKLSEDEAKKIRDSQRAIAAGNLKLNLAEQARNLRGKAMEQTGRGREFAEEEALRRAAEIKRGKLTAAEIANVRKIAALTWETDHRDTSKRADMTIRSNSLTARGGFAGGVRMPPVDQVNREIRNYNQQQVQRLVAIESMLHRLLEV